MDRDIYYRSDVSNACQKWLRSDEVGNLMKQMDPVETRVIGLMVESSDMPNYFDGLTDALDMFNVTTTASFDMFLNELSERL